MLSRTADNLFWLARYMERADFLARLIEATQRLSTLPTAYGGTGSEWESTLNAAGALETYELAFDKVTEGDAIHFLAFDSKNPSSIRNCIELARTNARAVRTALTIEMWQSINTAWLELKRFETSLGAKGTIDRVELSRFLDFVKKTSLDFDGSANRTMLRNDAYWFSRLGLYVERVDTTARILDVKYHVLLPETEAVGGTIDYFQWTAILRAVSALTAYHWVYKGGVKPWLVADLLILRPEMPRSLHFCYDNIVRLLDAIARAYGRQGPSQRHARSVLSRLENASIKEIFETGLHEFLTGFIEDNDRLGSNIAEQYLID
ncbi:MAG: alpha-E domain-containing protein [Beijerinckiaceae bacterium]|nr:alpha-E domain-containing protein [Beijerinckiaceae bacterium]